MKLNLGDKAVVMLSGEITEMRKICGKIRYTLSGHDFTQAFVLEEDIITQGGENNGITNTIIRKSK